MDFNDTPEEAKFRAEARTFLEANLSPKGAETERLSRKLTPLEYLKAAKAYQAKKAEAGFAGITWAKEQGGRGLAPIFSVIFGQEEGKFDAPAAPFAIGLGMCVPTVIAFADDATKDRYVAKALRGEEIWCQLFSEPGAGSDLAGLRTRAQRDGDAWVINGQKIWTSGAHWADWAILVARSDPKTAKHKGLSFFFLSMKSPGIETRRIKQISGASHFNEVYFTDVRIPDTQRLGAVGSLGVEPADQRARQVGRGAGSARGQAVELGAEGLGPPELIGHRLGHAIQFAGGEFFAEHGPFSASGYPIPRQY